MVSIAQDPIQMSRVCKSSKCWLRPVIHFGLLAVVCFFVFRALWQGLVQLDWRQAHFEIGYVLAAFLCVLGNMVLIATAFQATLARMCHAPLPFCEMLGITWISRAGRYIPGKVFTVVGMAYLLHARGIFASMSTGIVLINTVLAVIVGLMVSAPLLIGNTGLTDGLPWAWAGMLFIIIGGLVFLHPKLNFGLINFMLKRLHLPPLVRTGRWNDYAVPALHMVGQWLFAGAALWFLARSLQPDLTMDLIGPAVSVSALAFTLGFLALFAPAGIGVREAVYLVVLTPMLGRDNAAVVTVAVRVVYTLAELLLALIGLLILRYYPAVKRSEHCMPEAVTGGLERQ